MTGEIMLDDSEELFELLWDLGVRGQDNHERPQVLARLNLPGESLNKLDRAHEPVKIFQDHERGAGALRDLR
ncbi:MAG: hypothetical protein ACKO1M_01265 [Planctomycetota bacterium]